jgi:hypothetical protein
VQLVVVFTSPHFGSVRVLDQLYRPAFPIIRYVMPVFAGLPRWVSKLQLVEPEVVADSGSDSEVQPAMSTSPPYSWCNAGMQRLQKLQLQRG